MRYGWRRSVPLLLLAWGRTTGRGCRSKWPWLLAAMMPPHCFQGKTQEWHRSAPEWFDAAKLESRDLVVCDEARRAVGKAGFGTTRPGGACLAVWDCTGGFAGQGRQAGGRAGGLAIVELGTHARMKHLKIVEWWVDRVSDAAGRGWNEG